MRVLFILGTRPEVIKLAPVILECRKRSGIETFICSTGQHRQMLDQALASFGIDSDIDLQIMTANQSLTDLTSASLLALSKVFDKSQFDSVVVQGDTTTAMVGGLSAFYRNIPVVHVEAGLRTWDRIDPFPEELNRSILDQLADYCMAPTPTAEKNLLATGVTSDRIWITGNTAVDAIIGMAKKIADQPAPGSIPVQLQTAISENQNVLVVTGHRRESFGKDFEAICHAIKRISEENPKIHIVYPVHRNPNVQTPVHRILGSAPRIHLIDPLPYDEFVWLLVHSFAIVSDSGGIQEEAPSLDKPVLVIRKMTERSEGIDAGCAKLIGVNEDEIVQHVAELLNDQQLYARMSEAKNPYGDGKSAARIVDVIEGIPSRND